MFRKFRADQDPTIDLLCRFLLLGDGDDDAGGGGDGTDGDQGNDGADDTGDQGKNSDDGDGAASDDWRDTLPDDLKDHAKNFTSQADVVKKHFELRKQLSTAIFPPGKDATDDDVAAYRKQIGVPETAEGYKFATPEGTEPTENDMAFQKWAAETFHTANITADQASALSEKWNEFAAGLEQAAIDADKKFADESEAALRKEWRGDEYDRNKEFASQAALRLFGDEFDAFKNLETKDGRFVPDHPLMLKALAVLGREMAEGGLVPALNESERDAADDQLRDLRKKINAAQEARDGKLANKLYQQEQALIAKTQGNQNIVGAGGRAA